MPVDIYVIICYSSCILSCAHQGARSAPKRTIDMKRSEVLFKAAVIAALFTTAVAWFKGNQFYQSSAYYKVFSNVQKQFHSLPKHTLPYPTRVVVFVQYDEEIKHVLEQRERVDQQIRTSARRNFIWSVVLQPIWAMRQNEAPV